MESHSTRRALLRAAAAGSAGGLLVGGGSAAERAPERIVGITGYRAAEAARDRAASVGRTIRFGDLGQAVAGRFSDEAVERLRQRDDVRYVEDDGRMHAIGQRLPWGVDRVDADVLHDDGETGNGADVAIIDSGIDDDHPDLRGNLGAGTAYVDCSGADCGEPWSDDHDHGTHCAGIADAVDNSDGVVGVSTEATLHAVKVLDDAGSGSFSDVAAGIEYVADQGWDVGSLSLGASSGSQTVKDACSYAYDNGVLLVAAAGNDGPCRDCVGYPAAYEECIAVSATDDDDDLVWYSSTGPEVELAAPGGDIYSTVIGGYDTFSGTSMACPHVAGAGGHLMANGYSNTDARDRLEATAEDVGLSGNEQGAGLVDAEAAVLDGDGGDDDGEDDSAPGVSWANPTDGDTVADTVTVRIDASDGEDSDDSLDVTYTVDGGSERSTSYDAESGSYEDTWDTTAVEDGDHSLEATATDSAGNTTSSAITVTTDNADSGPAVDDLSAVEVETSSEDAAFDVDWSVSDDDGDLDTVDLEVSDDTDAETEATDSTSVAGDAGSGTTRLVAAGDDGSGNSYTVELTVTDGAGATETATTTVTETEDEDRAPTVDSYGVDAESTGSDAEITADWAVNDPDGDLDRVTVRVLDASTGRVVASNATDVGGADASGTDSFTVADGAGDRFYVTCSVTDETGNDTRETRRVTA
jgi:subtilisin